MGLSLTFGRVNLVRDVGIRMQTKHFGCIVCRQTIDVIDETLQTLGAGHPVSLVELKRIGEQLLAEPYRGEGGQQTLVEIICHPSAVLHLTNHVDKRLPGDTLLGIHFIQMILYELHACGEIGLIEFVGYIPAEWTELATFLHNGVQEGNGIQQRWPLRGRGVVQKVLRERLKRQR